MTPSIPIPKLGRGGILADKERPEGSNAAKDLEFTGVRLGRGDGLLRLCCVGFSITPSKHHPIPTGLI